jgi:hypothetical protein
MSAIRHLFQVVDNPKYAVRLCERVNILDGIAPEWLGQKLFVKAARLSRDAVEAGGGADYQTVVGWPVAPT